MTSTGDVPQPVSSGGGPSSDGGPGRYQQSINPGPCERAVEQLNQVEAEFVKLRTEFVTQPLVKSDAAVATADRISQKLLPRLNAVLNRFQMVFEQEEFAVVDRATLKEFVATRKQSWRLLADALREADAEKLKQHSELWMKSTVLGARVMATKRSSTMPTAAQSMRDFKQSLVGMTPRLIATPILVAINVLVFAAMVANGADLLGPTPLKIFEWGGNFAPRTLNGDWWRLVTCLFVHIGIFHLGFNMWVLWDLGRLVERLVGTVGFLVLYFVSGIAGSIASVAWNPAIISAGASGAVFGVAGGLLAFLAFQRKAVPVVVLKQLRNSMLLFLVFNLYYGMTSKGIDMAAHIGGLTAGFACGLILSQPLSVEMRARRKVRNLAAIVAGGVLLPLIAFALPRPPAVTAGELPTCTSKEVVDVVQQIVRNSAMGPTVKSLDGFRELSFDSKEMVRRGQCVVHSNSGDVNLQYSVRWQDRAKDQFEVRVLPTGLPSCTSSEVIEVLNRVIRQMATRTKVTSVTGFQEVSVDSKSSKRQGRCVAHTTAGDIELKYTVQWRNEAAGEFEVVAEAVKR
jgi:membrane associated rhomboid family serine protease